MFFSYDFLFSTYRRLINLDPSEGKSRKEKVSGLRYLLATSKLIKIHKEQENRINLAVGSNMRKKFIEAVGDIVSLGNNLYTKDFAYDLDDLKDFGVGSNFLTTRLANSRSQRIEYPGRPAHILLLEQESISILPNCAKTLRDSYGIDNVKAELSVWLLRNEFFDVKGNNVSIEKLKELIDYKLLHIYTHDLATALSPSESELHSLINEIETSIFSSDKADCSDIANKTPLATSSDEFLPSQKDRASLILPTVLKNDLPDNDIIFEIIEQLLARGAKGILFSGPPGTSKTWYALKVAMKIVSGDLNRLERVQFHPSYTYEDFIEGLVSTGSISGSEPLFKPRDKAFLNLCNKARQDTDNLYILVIDEFSRGDPSKIFGELLTYIESDYRDIKFRLPYSEKEISIPQNVIIFATMNPYDKSVSDIDSAMERRFDVVEFEPNVDILKQLLKGANLQGEVIGHVISFFKTVNRLSPHGFGHTYFKNVYQDADFVLLWNHKLKFIFKKMFQFEEESYTEVRNSFLKIVSEVEQDNIK